MNHSPSSVSDHLHQFISPNNLTKKPMIESTTMLGTVYKICIICLLETLKLLSAALLSSEEQKEKKSVKNDHKTALPPPTIRTRTRSKVVCVKSLKVDSNWLLQQQQKHKTTRASSRRIVKCSNSTTIALTSTTDSPVVTTRLATPLSASIR